MIDVRNRLRELRDERHWTQADLAQRLDVSRQTVNALEKGRYDPSLPLAFRIAAAMPGMSHAGPRLPSRRNDRTSWARCSRCHDVSSSRGGGTSGVVGGELFIITWASQPRRMPPLSAPGSRLARVT